MTESKGRRRIFYLAASFVFACVVLLILVGGSIWFLLSYSRSPIADHWNPLRDLSITAPVTPVTQYQLNRALEDNALCRAILSRSGVQFEPMDDLVVDQNCGIAGRGVLSKLVVANLSPVETSCATALRLALWEHHVVQPQARSLMNTNVSRLQHLGSYNCRKMRTSQGESTHWSSHATADAIDISGVVLDDGRRLSLLKDWDGIGPARLFLHQIGTGACSWFKVVLGPKFNPLHSDHFHLQGSGWGYCR